MLNSKIVKELISVTLALLVATVMVAISWNEWLHHAVDSYLSIHIFNLLKEGKALYSAEAPYFYGPLIPYLYNFLLSFFNKLIDGINLLGVIQFYLIIGLFYYLVRQFQTSFLAALSTSIFVLLFGITAVNHFEAHTLVVSYNIVSSYALLFILLIFLGALKKNRTILQTGIFLLTMTRPEIGFVAMILFFPYKIFKPIDFIHVGLSIVIYTFFAFKIGFAPLLHDNLFWAPHISSTPWTREIFWNGDYKGTVIGIVEALLIFAALKYKNYYLLAATFVLSTVSVFIYSAGSVTVFLSFLGVLLLFKERSLLIIFSLFLISKLFFSLSLDYYAFYLAPPLFIIFLYTLKNEKVLFTTLIIAAIFLPKVVKVQSQTIPFFLEERSPIEGAMGTQLYLKSREHAGFYKAAIDNLRKKQPDSLLCLPDCVFLNDQLEIPSRPTIPNVAMSAYPLIKGDLIRGIKKELPELIILFNEDGSYRGEIKNWFQEHLADFIKGLGSDYQLIENIPSKYPNVPFLRSAVIVLQRTKERPHEE